MVFIIFSRVSRAALYDLNSVYVFYIGKLSDIFGLLRFKRAHSLGMDVVTEMLFLRIQHSKKMLLEHSRYLVILSIR